MSSCRAAPTSELSFKMPRARIVKLMVCPLSALGIYGPGYQTVIKYFGMMLSDLWADKDKHGCEYKSHHLES